jgi:hypothetical protein
MLGEAQSLNKAGRYKEVITKADEILARDPGNQSAPLLKTRALTMLE